MADTVAAVKLQGADFAGWPQFAGHPSGPTTPVGITYDFISSSLVVDASGIVLSQFEMEFFPTEPMTIHVHLRWALVDNNCGVPKLRNASAGGLVPITAIASMPQVIDPALGPELDVDYAITIPQAYVGGQTRITSFVGNSFLASDWQYIPPNSVNHTVGIYPETVTAESVPTGSGVQKAPNFAHQLDLSSSARNGALLYEPARRT